MRRVSTVPSAWVSTSSSSDPISGSAIPELPETETIARDLDRAVAGSTIVGVRVRHADVLREVSARTLNTRITGTTILRAWRRAKLVILDLSSGDRLVVQPRFTGALLINPSDER
ncbi:MAG TPA: DNA-formamidopyrimidine glycosylase family protein, partial [Gemmatimonadaceae bacterium]|nr:DNA-formamidopyrimidine glycosylase family protein [Gemmatimonadaceae bacterium]